MRFIARYRIRKLIAYHTRMRHIHLYVRNQHSVYDMYSVTLWDKAQWHERFINRLEKLLKKYI